MYELPIVLGGFAPTFPTYVPLGPGEASRPSIRSRQMTRVRTWLSYVRPQRTTSLGPGRDWWVSSEKSLKWTFAQSRRIVAFGPKLPSIDHMDAASQSFERDIRCTCEIEPNLNSHIAGLFRPLTRWRLRPKEDIKVQFV